MSPQEYYQKELEACQRDWLQGHFRAIPEAIAICHAGGHPLPDWLAEATLEALAVAFEHGGAPGRGKTGGHSVRSARSDRDWMRWTAAMACLKDRRHDVTEDEAFEQAQAMLAGTPSQGSPLAIKASYYRINRFRNSG
jgi:hypothetical protein